MIEGETLIKPKIEFAYTYIGLKKGNWSISKDVPVTYRVVDNTIYVKWNASYHGQFDLSYADLTKTIVVESLF